MNNTLSDAIGAAEVTRYDLIEAYSNNTKIVLIELQGQGQPKHEELYIDFLVISIIQTR